MTATPYILLDDSLSQGGASLLYEAPKRVIVAWEPGEVETALGSIEAGLSQGLHAAGFFAYELGYCLEPKLRDLLPKARTQPLLWIGLCREPRRLDDSAVRAWLEENGANDRSTLSDLNLSWSRGDYMTAFDKVQNYIAAGDVYQINLTLKYRFAFAGNPVALYAALRRKQRVAYGGLIGTPDFHVLSLSLFSLLGQTPHLHNPRCPPASSPGRFTARKERTSSCAGEERGRLRCCFTDMRRTATPGLLWLKT